MAPVSFDLWDTLLWHPSGSNPARDDRVALVARLTRRHPVQVARALRSVGLPLEQTEPRDLTVAAQMRRALAVLRAPSAVVAEAAEGMARLAARYPPVPVPGLRRALARLARRERLAVVSNTRWTSGAALEQVLEDEGLAGLFATMAFSDQTGWAKPAAAAFAAAWSRIGVDPRTTVHVGDRADRDVEGARRCGARAVVCRVVRAAREAGDRHADAILYDYAGLDAILARVSDQAIAGWEVVGEGVPVLGPPVLARASFFDAVPELRMGRIALLADDPPAPEGLATRAAAVVAAGGWGGGAARLVAAAAIPCVAGADGLSGRIAEGDLLLVDGATGRIHAPLDRRGRLVGTFGTVGCWSCQASKAVPCGEGGILATDDPLVFERALLTIDWGPRVRRRLAAPVLGALAETGYGLKHRMHPFAALLGLGGLRGLDALNGRRTAVLTALAGEIADVPGLVPPPIRTHEARAWYRFVIRSTAGREPRRSASSSCCAPRGCRHGPARRCRCTGTPSPASPAQGRSGLCATPGWTCPTQP